MYKLTANADIVELILSSTSKKIISKGSFEWKMYEAWLSEGNTAEPIITIDEFRSVKAMQIKHAFGDSTKDGFLTSDGLHVDAGREDLDNLEDLHDYCIRNSLAETILRLSDNSEATVTMEDLQRIINEVKDHNLNLRAKKWAKEQAIKAAKNMAQLEKITWESVEEEQNKFKDIS